MREETIQKFQIFISYRRNGTDAHARVFYEKLKEMGYKVFLDFESTFFGGYKMNILKTIENCDDFILILPQDGLERCNEECDPLREEIRAAVKFNKNIIPIFVNGFKMPSENTLPKEIAKIAEHSGIECSMEYFDAVFTKVIQNLSSRPEDEHLFKSLKNMRKKILDLDHAYFKKWACMKLDSFLSENDRFLDGTNMTNPHAEDTFGVSGIEYTKNNLKALSYISDYWKDGFTIEYLKKQGELIKKGVSITRIFICDPVKSELIHSQMEYQRKIGIDVYYIDKGNEYINPEWLMEDYLIQDDKLLVQIYCNSHQFNGTNNSDEEITLDTYKVKQKVERFKRILERSTKFE